MRLARFEVDGVEALGVVLGDEVAAVAAADPSLPSDIAAVFAADALDAVGAAASSSKVRHPLETVRLRCPVPRPATFLAIGLNYEDHLAEAGLERPNFPVFFNKQVSCLTGPFDPVHKPRDAMLLDYEGELGFVVGRRCRHVPRERAREVIGGFFVADDVTARDWQFRSPTMTLGKSFDTHGPIGPWVVTTDEIDDPHDLLLRCWVNDELRQEASTGGMLWDCWDQLATLSTVCTLEPGDLVATGTPAGVGITRQPPGLLSVGDVVRVEIEGIGMIENPIIDEPAETAIG